MKKIAKFLLLKEIYKSLRDSLFTPEFGTNDKTQAAELEKAWYSYQKDKESNIADSDKQRKLLYQFMHLHREKDLN